MKVVKVVRSRDGASKAFALCGPEGHALLDPVAAAATAGKATAAIWAILEVAAGLLKGAGTGFVGVKGGGTGAGGSAEPVPRPVGESGVWSRGCGGLDGRRRKKLRPGGGCLCVQTGPPPAPRLKKGAAPRGAANAPLVLVRVRPSQSDDTAQDPKPVASAHPTTLGSEAPPAFMSRPPPVFLSRPPPHLFSRPPPVSCSGPRPVFFSGSASVFNSWSAAFGSVSPVRAVPPPRPQTPPVPRGSTGVRGRASPVGGAADGGSPPRRRDWAFCCKPWPSPRGRAAREAAAPATTPAAPPPADLAAPCPSSSGTHTRPVCGDRIGAASLAPSSVCRNSPREMHLAPS
jgi:hypothetical protein